MKALLLVDIQNDFLPGGALPVPTGDEIVRIANQLLDHFPLVIATQDWHPADHGSFAANHPGKDIGEVIELNGLSQILWPVHCVRGSGGAQFAPELQQERIDHVVTKGTNREIDSYSGFFDNGHRQETELNRLLVDADVSELYVMGLATDYCVKFTALDAVQLGFQTHLIADGCRGVELSPGDIDHALQEMEAAGVQVVDSRQLVGSR